MIFFCLDSTLKFHRPLAEGELGASQRDWVRRKMRRIESSLPASGAEYVKIAVLHHHCVQIPGTGGQGERFMQLLDGGDTLQMLDDLGFHVVTHGHKHVPHSLQRIRTDTSGLTIVGAGTATCPYVEEQAGHGNNFNVLDFDVSRNALSVRVFRAGAEGRFQGGAEAKNYSLFRSQPLGYAIQEMRKISELSADGTMRTVLEKRNMRVEQPGKEIHYIDVRIIAEAPGSRITGFLPCSSPKFKPRIVEETRIEGQWILETPLKIDGAPVTARYSYALEGGTAMTQSAHTQLYGRDGDTEWTAVIIQNPVDKLRLELQLPTVPRFDVTVRPEGEHLGQKYPNEYFEGRGFLVDKTANRYVLEVDHPPIGHRFSLIWELPAKWDPVLGMAE